MTLEAATRPLDEDMAEAGKEIRRDGNVGDWEDTLRYRSDFDN